MAHDVFISHSSKDKNAADAICHALENNGVKCWIAPRDVSPGAEYAGELTSGIKNCNIFLLVFSEASNTSGPVSREIETAFRYEKTVIPFRIENVEMRESLEYYLANLHWLEAFPDDKEFYSLVTAVKRTLGMDLSSPKPEAESKPKPAPAAQSQGWTCHCGNSVTDGMLFCTRCGAKYGESETPPQAQSAPQTQPEPLTPPPVQQEPQAQPEPLTLPPVQQEPPTPQSAPSQPATQTPPLPAKKSKAWIFALSGAGTLIIIAGIIIALFLSSDSKPSTYSSLDDDRETRTRRETTTETTAAETTTAETTAAEEKNADLIVGTWSYNDVEEGEFSEITFFADGKYYEVWIEEDEGGTEYYRGTYTIDGSRLTFIQTFQIEYYDGEYDTYADDYDTSEFEFSISGNTLKLNYIGYDGTVYDFTPAYTKSTPDPHWSIDYTAPAVNNSIVGTWKGEIINDDGDSIETTYIFYDDGMVACGLVYKSGVYAFYYGTYSYSGNKAAISFIYEEIYTSDDELYSEEDVDYAETATLNGNTLDVVAGSDTYTLTRRE